MPNEIKRQLLTLLESKFGRLRKLPGSQSLIELPSGVARLYLRYSKQHAREKSFFGLRKIDLNQLDGHNSFICFFSDDGAEPYFLPHQDFAAVIRASPVRSPGTATKLSEKWPFRDHQLSRIRECIRMV